MEAARGSMRRQQQQPCAWPGKRCSPVMGWPGACGKAHSFHAHAQQPCRGPWQVMVYREEGCAHYGDQESSMFRPSQIIPGSRCVPRWRAALPRPGQAGPGLLRLLPAGGGHRMTCRAGLRGLLRGAPPSSRTGARKRRGGACGNMREPTLFLRSRPAVSSVHECTNRANMGWSRSCKPGLA